MLFQLALEHERHGGLRLVGRQLLALGGEEIGSLERTRGHVDDELHQTLGAYVAFAAATEDGHHVALGHAQLQSRADIVLRERSLLEIELHQGIVVYRGRFGKLLIQLLGALQLLGGDLQLLARAVVVGEAVHLHHQHVDERVECRALLHGVLHYDGFHGRRGADPLQHGFVIGLVAV